MKKKKREQSATGKTQPVRRPGGPTRSQSFYTVKEVAEMYKFCEKTIRNHINNKLLPCSWAGGTRIRISPDDLLVWRLRVRRILKPEDRPTSTPSSE